jgi:hypothetical protein
MDNLPSNSFDDGVRFPSLEEDLELSEAAIRARAAAKRENKGAKPIRFKREAVLEHIMGVFHNIGGEPRMTEWADQNPGDFYKNLVAKVITPAINQLAVNASGPVQIVCPIQRSALDDAPDLSPDGLPVLPLKDVTND